MIDERPLIADEPRPSPSPQARRVGVGGLRFVFRLSPLRLLFTVLSVFTTALKRLRANAGLALCALIAATAAVALSVSIPVYAEAASLRLLKSEIAQQEQRAQRSAFALMFRYYIGGRNAPLEWERVKPVDDYLSGRGLERLELPLQGLARHARTEPLRMLFPPALSSAGGENEGGTQNPFLKNVSVGFLSGMDQQIRYTSGSAPRPATSLDQTVEVAIMRALADEIGVNVGEQFTLLANVSGRSLSIPIRIVGLWEPINAADPAWFYPPDAFHDIVVVPEQTFTGPLAAALKNDVSQIVWFARFNGRNLTAAEAMPLLARVERVRALVAGRIPGLTLEPGLTDALTRYRSEARALTVQMFVFSVPILALVLYFAALVAGLLVNRQRGEIALLKTRGVRDGQILGMYVVEWLILGGLALAIGPLLGLGFARVMGQTQSFLSLSDEIEPLALALTANGLSFGIAAVLLAMAAALVPAAAATRRTLVDEQQQAARAAHKPFWQRLYLDVLLLLPPLYGLYQLRTRGGIQVGGVQGADVLTNPLLVLVPVLFCFALGLLAVRFIPLLLELLARLAARPSWVAPLVALRALARQPGAYRGPLLLLILTLSLATFSASMAATLDGALRQAITYRVGAPMQLFETGASTERPTGGQPGGQPSGSTRRNIADEARFIFVPVSQHLQVRGITAATRVATYDDTSVQLGGQVRNAQLVGIDRLDFPKVVSHFDPAWADGLSLGALMNLLAQRSDGVIVSREVLEKGYTIGDTLPVLLRLYGDQREVKFTIVAVVDLWPGYYPQDGPILVTNLDYVFDQMSGQYPYDVWITRADDAEPDAIVQGVRQQGIAVVRADDAATLIRDEQAQPRRQGLFGLLSVGFIAAGALTLLGFLLAGLITARRRAIELGVLRAIGMGGGQVAAALVLEQALLVGGGIGAGTGIGLLAARLVVPLLQVGVGPHPGTPAYPAQLAWDQVTLIYLVFGVALLLTLGALAWLLGRMQLFQVIKLGDAN